MRNRTYLAIFAATTFLTTGVAFAANQPSADQQKASAQRYVLDKDFGKLSADGSQAFQDVTLARLAIFDGRTDDAKTLVDAANTSFGKAAHDESVFTKAEADMKPPQGGAANAMPARDGQAGAKTADTKTPVEWLPVNGTVSIDEDYTLNPTKAAAVSDANKSLKSGDSKGALEKLRLANVDVNVTMAVVPLNKTISEVQQAATLINGGKFYEASQALRQAQNGERFDVVSVSDRPKRASDAAVEGNPQPAASTTAPATSK